MRGAVSARRALVREVTRVGPAPACPELRLHLAADCLRPWEATEALEGCRQGPPFWAHAWPGGCALARWVLDHPEVARGHEVLDFAAGCGVSALAAARGGARRVVATEVDAFAVAAIEENAGLNGLEVEARCSDVLGTDEGWGLVLVGDVFYEAELSRRVEGWLRALRRRGATVLIGDPGRSFLPRERLRCVATLSVPVAPAWDSVTDRPARLWALEP